MDLKEKACGHLYEYFYSELKGILKAKAANKCQYRHNMGKVNRDK